MAIKELGYVVVGTQDLQAWHDYMTGVVGAMEGESGDGARHYRVDDRPFRFRVVEAVEDRLLAAAYEIDSREALDALAGRIENAGQSVSWLSDSEAAARGVDAAFACHDPAGNGLEFYCGDTRDDVAFESPQGVEGFITGEGGMGHAVFAAPDFDASHAFYRNTCGFHDTDLPHFKFSPDPEDPGIRFAFMHADNGRHHSVAIGEMPPSPAHCVHLMLEMIRLEDVKACHARMEAAGVPESASLGKHTNDKMTSFYMQTPSGFDLEIGCDGLVIDPATWEPTAHKTASDWGHEWAWQKAMAEDAAEEAAE